VNIHNILLWLNECMETPARMVNDILNNALFQSSPRINQTLHQIFYTLHFCILNSLLNYAPDFVVNWIEVKKANDCGYHLVVTLRSGLFGGRKSRSLQGWPRSLRLLHFTSGGCEWRTNCLSEHSMQKRSQPEKSVKTDTVVSQCT